MYYAAVNAYATETSVGFANTWDVIGFATRTMRDAYVSHAPDLATKAIKSNEVRKYGGRIGQIDYYDRNGDKMVHIRDDKFANGTSSIDPITAEKVTSAYDKSVAEYWA